MLKIQDLKKVYKKNVALQGVSFSVESKSAIGLIGDNGAGKTTLIKCISGLVAPTSGSIYFNDVNLIKNPKYIHNTVGVLLEGARNLYNFLTVDYNLNYFSYLNQLSSKETSDRKAYLLKLFDAEKYQDQPVNELSRGTQQKIALMVTLMKNPQLLILDEPTLGLDLIATMRMTDLLRQIIQEEQKTVIIISHDMTLVSSLCDRVVYLKNGKVDFDEQINSIVNENIYEVKIKADNSMEEKIQNFDFPFRREDGIYVLEVHDMERMMKNKLLKENIISIEKQVNDLAHYIRMRSL